MWLGRGFSNRARRRPIGRRRIGRRRIGRRRIGRRRIGRRRIDRRRRIAAGRFFHRPATSGNPRRNPAFRVELVDRVNAVLGLLPGKAIRQTVGHWNRP
jgi:hypothetical protein